MYSVSLTLDKIRMISPADELEVSVNSSVSLICPDENIHSLEPPQLLELLRSGKFWVTRGNGCRLEFTILFNGHKVDCQSRETVIQNLSYYLQGAPLWSQVALDAKFHLPQSDESNSWPCFTIGLRHAFSTGLSPPSGDLELPAAADIKAPVSVTCLQLETVKICMNFSSSKTSYTKGSKRSEYLSGLQLVPESSKFPEEQHGRLDEHSSNDGLFRHKSAMTFHGGLYEDEKMLDEEILSIQDDGLFSLPASQSSAASSLVSRSSQESQSGGMNYTKPNIRVSPNINSAQRMAECALRTLIGGRQTKSQPEFKVLKPRSGQSLSQIAPALWSPGFLDAVSQRSRFVPTISHVFSNTCLNNAVSPNLRRKLADLASKEIASPHAKPMKGHCDQDAIQDDLGGRELSDTVDDVIQGRIWRLMQLSLYDPLAARRLKPPQNDGDQQVEIVTEEPAIAEEYMRKNNYTRYRPQEYENAFPPEDEFYNLLDDTLDGEADSVFEALLDDAKYEPFEDLLDGIQDGLGGARDMDASDKDTMERNKPPANFYRDGALDMDTTFFWHEMDVTVDIDDELQADNQTMLL